MVPVSRSTFPAVRSCSGPTRLLSTADGGGPKYVTGTSLPIEGGEGCTSICARAAVAPSSAHASAREYVLLDMVLLLGVTVRSSGHAPALRRRRNRVTRSRAGRGERPIPRARPASLRQGGTRASA